MKVERGKRTAQRRKPPENPPAKTVLSAPNPRPEEIREVKRKQRGAATPPIEQVMSFLKDTRGALTWTTATMANELGIGIPEAKRVLAVMQLQGYVKHNAALDQWMTTLAGETVSGSKKPRFTLENVEQALEDLRERIKSANKDAAAEFKVSDAVAYGDFLEDSVGHGARVQAADVGIELVRRKVGAGGGQGPAREHEARKAFLKELRGSATMLHLREYAEWMSARPHRKLL